FLSFVCTTKQRKDMGKSTHFTGQPVYSQVIKLLLLSGKKIKTSKKKPIFLTHQIQYGKFIIPFSILDNTLLLHT
ncbi:MAG: hypothetical protein EOM76_06070, partial [Sphingobacteriia bacterium]|nr:hypothetical protein [Sphingobacteriia bacterium]